ncbi:hypothetical protein B9Q04_01960 [Candidatus Marsarchaeota G2 archaeon BE_D]|uniref:ABC transmembrane type-1 domain-containing protein n=1 Tax=Candidatus Marsarchaeota G2 archaeon BE_D TaxID=1978158 RepID=A0A2R6CE50_9ARCH|nr:MAG: hypothetical protein B9Q04_01960 [Candidatus Marsarchaeota G2 archaeon BE_D]
MERLILRVLRRRNAQIGLAIVMVFVLIGALGPYISAYSNPYSPSQFYAAGPDALPSWMSVFPGYSHLNPNIILPSSQVFQTFKTPEALGYWKVGVDPSSRVSLSVGYARGVGPADVAAEATGAYLLTNTGNGSEVLSVSGNSTNPVYVYLTHTFYYGYSPPPLFYSQVAVKPVLPPGVGFAVMLLVNTSKGVYYTSLAANAAGETALESLPSAGSSYAAYFASTFSQPLVNDSWNLVSGVTNSANDMPLAFFNRSVPITTVPQTIFSQKGYYSVGELLVFFPNGDFHASLYQSDFKFQIFGRVYGVLGTDADGGDVWSEFVSGTRTALAIGFGSAAIALGVGVILGLIAGFFAGLVDSVLVFAFDFLLLLPGLILLIDLDTVFTVAHVVTSKALLIILLLGFLGWAVPGRTVRSQVLSLRRRTYVEAAKTMGGGNFYILRNHVLKHTTGTIVALITYLVPGLVVADTGLDFLGLGIDRYPTWGNILAKLINEVTPSNGYLWWITMPIGLSIILISIAFYLIGTAIQEEYSRLG